MTTYSEMGSMFEQGKLTPAIDELYIHSATPTGVTSPVVTTNPGLLSGLASSLTGTTISNPFAWFTEGSQSALALAEKLLTDVYSVGDAFTDSLSGEVRNAKGEITKAKGAYANLAKTLALAGALGGGYSYLSNKQEDLESRVPQTNAKAKPPKKGKPKGKAPRRKSRRL